MDRKENSLDYLLFRKYLELRSILNFDRDKPYWDNIPISSNYITCLNDIYKPGMSLIDLGCGAGNVLRYAKNIGYSVFGVEFNKELTIFLGAYPHLHKDITTLDKEEYSKYDIIYSYKPLKDEFEDYINMIIDNMKSGAYILTPQFNINNKQVKSISRFLYQKI